MEALWDVYWTIPSPKVSRCTLTESSRDISQAPSSNPAKTQAEMSQSNDTEFTDRPWPAAAGHLETLFVDLVQTPHFCVVLRTYIYTV